MNLTQIKLLRVKKLQDNKLTISPEQNPSVEQIINSELDEGQQIFFM